MAENETSSDCITSQNTKNEDVEVNYENDKSTIYLKLDCGDLEDEDKHEDKLNLNKDLKQRQSPNLCDSNSSNKNNDEGGSVSYSSTTNDYPDVSNNQVMNDDPLPGSSNESIKQESPDDHTVWLPSTNIKTESQEENDPKEPDSEEDEESEEELGDEERLEEESDAEMDDESNGAYHLAEVSYGEENEDSEKAEGTETNSTVRYDASHTFLTTIDNDGMSGGIVPDKDTTTSTVVGKLKRFVCNECNYQTNHRPNLKCHLKSHKEGAFSCCVCRFKTSSRYQLINHNKEHKNADMFTCTECNYTTQKMHAMKEHFRIHTGEKPFSCTECSFKCSSRNSLHKHKRIHTGETPYSCTLCERKFKQSGHLTEHMRQHTGEKPFKCPVCDYRCAYRCRINRHMEMHSDEKPFICSECPYRAKNKATINLHIRNHAEKGLQACPLCDYKCNGVSQLKEHTYYMHNQETFPFGCALCEARFVRKRCLIKHLQAHDEDKMLVCDVCDMKFLSRVKKKKHMMCFHGQES